MSAEYELLQLDLFRAISESHVGTVFLCWRRAGKRVTTLLVPTEAL